MRRRMMAGGMAPRRMGRPGLLGTAARTAVVAGTATAVAGGVSRHQQQRADDQQTAQDQQVPVQPVPVQQVPVQQAAPMGDSQRLDRIKELGQMRDQGLLTDQEFASEKARLLAT